MGEKCLKQYHTYYECYQTSNIITLSQFYNFPNLGLKYHLPRMCVCGGDGGYSPFMGYGPPHSPHVEQPWYSCALRMYSI